jgi:hypothetical protein
VWPREREPNTLKSFVDAENVILQVFTTGDICPHFVVLQPEFKMDSIEMRHWPTERLNRIMTKPAENVMLKD